MDGSPSRGETIPIRLFLGGFDLTPTFRDVNKKFSTRYYLSLVLIDEGTFISPSLQVRTLGILTWLCRCEEVFQAVGNHSLPSSARTSEFPRAGGVTGAATGKQANNGGYQRGMILQPEGTGKRGDSAMLVNCMDKRGGNSSAWAWRQLIQTLRGFTCLFSTSYGPLTTLYPAIVILFQPNNHANHPMLAITPTSSEVSIFLDAKPLH